MTILTIHAELMPSITYTKITAIDGASKNGVIQAGFGYRGLYVITDDTGTTTAAVVGGVGGG